MKRLVSLLAVGTALVAASAPVSEGDSLAAAKAWAAEGHAIDAGGGVVTGIVTRALGDGMFCRVALRDDGGALFMSPDDEMPPVLAVIPPSPRFDGPYACPSLLGILLADIRSMSASISSNPLDRTVLKSSAGASAGASAERRRSVTRWRQLVSGTRSVPLKAASSAGTPSAYTVPGFESGGIYTHWNQAADANSFSLRRPVYNSYMRDRATGGPVSGGLGLHLGWGSYGTAKKNFSTAVPCGCVATAWSALFQFLGFRGHSVAKSCSISYPALARWDDGMDPSDIDWSVSSAFFNTVPGEYDWSILPVNYGGSADRRKSWELTNEQRLLLGRVTFNCGLLVGMRYGQSSSGAVMENMATSLKSTTSGFGEFSKSWSAYSTWTSDLVGSADSSVRAGRPVVLSIGASSTDTGHCVLAVGRDSDTGMSRIFFGYGGSSDGWYATDSTVAIGSYTIIRKIAMCSGYGDTVVPVYGRIVSASGSPVSGAIVMIKANGAAIGTTTTDSDGYYRTFYKVPSGLPAPTRTAPSSFTETVSVFGESKTATRTVCEYGEIQSESLSLLGNSDRGAITLPAGGAYDVIPGFYDIVADGDISADVEVAAAAGLPLVVAVGNAVTNTDVSCVRVIQGDEIRGVKVYMAGLAGFSEDEFLVIDASRLEPGKSPFSRGPHIMAYGSYDNDFDISKAVKDGIGRFATRP